MMTDRQIKALVPTLSWRPPVYYDLVRRLVAEGFVFRHNTAEWSNGRVRGRICCTATKAWLRHPSSGRGYFKTTREIHG